MPRLLSQMIPSSRPAVEPKKSLAQKFSPVKFFDFPLKVAAIEIALLPLINPTTLDIEYFGGIQAHVNMIRHQMTLHNLTTL